MKSIYIDNIISGSEQESPEVDELVEVEVANPAKVILFDDEWHTFDEVINQIIKATNCDYDKAQQITWQVHNNGKAVVYSGDMPECLRVSAVLEEIALHTEIEM
ncbi:ATP-dependent Clp protease adaptor ClpS [bacterium]|nr:MAG: ATP-dependent Clp protease adaptor ClpS [bacterium]